MESISSGLDCILPAPLWRTLMISVILYIGRRSRVFPYIALYALTCLLLETTVLAMERPPAVSHLLTYVLSNSNVLRGVLYGLTAVLMMAVLCGVLELKLTLSRPIAPSPLSVWPLKYERNDKDESLSLYASAISNFSLVQAYAKLAWNNPSSI